MDQSIPSQIPKSSLDKMAGSPDRIERSPDDDKEGEVTPQKQASSHAAAAAAAAVEGSLASPETPRRKGRRVSQLIGKYGRRGSNPREDVPLSPEQQPSPRPTMAKESSSKRWRKMAKLFGSKDSSKRLGKEGKKRSSDKKSSSHRSVDDGNTDGEEVHAAHSFEEEEEAGCPTTGDERQSLGNDEATLAEESGGSEPLEKDSIDYGDTQSNTPQHDIRLTPKVERSDVRHSDIHFSPSRFSSEALYSSPRRKSIAARRMNMEQKDIVFSPPSSGTELMSRIQNETARLKNRRNDLAELGNIKSVRERMKEYQESVRSPIKTTSPRKVGSLPKRQIGASGRTVDEGILEPPTATSFAVLRRSEIINDPKTSEKSPVAEATSQDSGDQQAHDNEIITANDTQDASNSKEFDSKDPPDSSKNDENNFQNDDDTSFEIKNDQGDDKITELQKDVSSKACREKSDILPPPPIDQDDTSADRLPAWKIRELSAKQSPKPKRHSIEVTDGGHITLANDNETGEKSESTEKIGEGKVERISIEIQEADPSLIMGTSSINSNIPAWKLRSLVQESPKPKRLSVELPNSSEPKNAEMIHEKITTSPLRPPSPLNKDTESSDDIIQPAWKIREFNLKQSPKPKRHSIEVPNVSKEASVLDRECESELISEQNQEIAPENKQDTSTSKFHLDPNLDEVSPSSRNPEKDVLLENEKDLVDDSKKGKDMVVSKVEAENKATGTQENDEINNEVSIDYEQNHHGNDVKSESWPDSETMPESNVRHDDEDLVDDDNNHREVVKERNEHDSDSTSAPENVVLKTETLIDGEAGLMGVVESRLIPEIDGTTEPLESSPEMEVNLTKEEHQVESKTSNSSMVPKDNAEIGLGTMKRRSVASGELHHINEELRSLDTSKPSLDLNYVQNTGQYLTSHVTEENTIKEHPHHVQKTLSKELEAAEFRRSVEAEELGSEVVSNLNTLAVPSSTTVSTTTDDSIHGDPSTRKLSEIGQPPYADIDSESTTHIDAKSIDLAAGEVAPEKKDLGVSSIAQQEGLSKRPNNVAKGRETAESVTEYEDMTVDESLFYEEEIIEEEILEETERDESSVQTPTRSDSLRSFNSSSSSFHLRFNSAENTETMIDLNLKDLDIQDAVKQQHFKVIGDLQQLLEETKQQKEAQKMKKTKLLEDVGKAKRDKDEKRSLKEKVLQDLRMSIHSKDLNVDDLEGSQPAFEAQKIPNESGEYYDEFNDFEDFRVKYGLGEEEMTDILSHLKLCEETNTDVRWDLIHRIIYPDDLSFYNENPGAGVLQGRESFVRDDSESSDGASYFSIYPEFDGNVSQLTMMTEFEDMPLEKRHSRGNLKRASSLGSSKKLRRSQTSGFAAESNHSASKPLSKRATQILDGASSHRQPDPMLQKRISDLWASQHSHRNSVIGRAGTGGRGAGLLQRASSARALKMSGFGAFRGLSKSSSNLMGSFRSINSGGDLERESGQNSKDLSHRDSGTHPNKFQESMYSFFEELTITEGADDSVEEESQT